MKNNRMISMSVGNLTPAFPHRSPVGESRMNITHTHPTYADSAQRMDKLRDLKKTCVRLLQAQRKK